MLPLFLSLFTFTVADIPLQVLPPPRITSAPSAAAEPAAEVLLSVGRFRFVQATNYAGPITWDWTGEKNVSAFALKSGTEFPGFFEGGKRAELHKVPESQSEVLVVFGESPGLVTVTGWGVKDGKPFKLGTQVISVGGARPPPAPDDSKKIEPGKLKSGYVAVLYDDKQLFAGAAALLGDTAWKRSLENIPGVKDFRTYDVTLPEKDNDAIKLGYLAEADKFRKSQGVTDWRRPVMITISEPPDPKLADVRFFPTTSKADAEAAIKEVIKP